MKKLLTIIAVMMALLVSCPTPSNNPDNPNNPNNPNNPGNKTKIVFDNTRGICTVAVYDNYQRREGDKIAEIPAGRLSEEIEYTPGDLVPFYFLYKVSLKGINGFTLNYVPKEVGKDQTAVRIEANKKTTISIPKLDETVISSDEFLSDKSYLLIQNNSSYSFRLHRGNSIITPDNSSVPLVSNGEKAQYTITPGDVSPYQLLVGADYKAFPGSITSFRAGHLYNIVFDGAVSLIEEIEIKLGNAAGIIQSSPGLYRGEAKIGTQDLASSLAWISTNAVNGDDFYIVLGNDESSLPISLNYYGRTVGITLLGYGGERKITLSANGNLFTVNSGVTLTIGENITLVGRSANTGALVRLNNGKLIVNAGSKITGNTVSSSSSVSASALGGGVYVTGTNADFIMNGGEITGNTSSVLFGNGRGGGVYIDSGGTFTMTGGEIAGNNASTSNSGIGAGGGVFVYNLGSFTMNSGIISGNTTSGSGSSIGGGVCVFGSFTMNGGVITGNTAGNSASAPGWGGGVEVLGTFTMHKGVISGNTASRSNTGDDKGGGGGGVDVDNDGNFIMDGGEITGNTSSFGGGVLVEVGVFTMTGGEISGNTGSTSGGGVYVDEDGDFAMDGGNITNNTSYAGGGVFADAGTFTMDNGKINSNTAIYGGGIYMQGSFTMKSGVITGNTGSTSGGGVYVDEGSFEMNGGEISGNTSSTSGGGVVVDEGTFVMQDGEISGNTAYTYGGGVYVTGTESSFIKTGGIITGYASDTVNGNAVKNSLGAIQNNRGHAVYVSPTMRRENTAGAEDNLDSSDGGEGWK